MIDRELFVGRSAVLESFSKLCQMASGVAPGNLWLSFATSLANSNSVSPSPCWLPRHSRRFRLIKQRGSNPSAPSSTQTPDPGSR